MPNEIQVGNLKREASTDKVLNDALHLFASRERGRKELTVGALTNSMRKAGFEYTRKEVAPILIKLSKLGFGHLEKDDKGRVAALRGIKVTMQSLGKVAIQETEDEALQYTTGTRKMPRAPKAAPKPQKQPKQAPQETRPNKTVLILTVMINDIPINLQVPKGLSTQQIAEVISRFQE